MARRVDSGDYYVIPTEYVPHERLDMDVHVVRPRFGGCWMVGNRQGSWGVWTMERVFRCGLWSLCCTLLGFMHLARLWEAEMSLGCRGGRFWTVDFGLWIRTLDSGLWIRTLDLDLDLES